MTTFKIKKLIDKMCNRTTTNLPCDQTTQIYFQVARTANKVFTKIAATLLLQADLLFQVVAVVGLSYAFTRNFVNPRNVSGLLKIPAQYPKKSMSAGYLSLMILAVKMFYICSHQYKTHELLLRIP